MYVMSVSRLEYHPEGTSDVILTLPVEKSCHGAHKCQLEVAVSVESVSVWYPHSEVTVDAHLFNLCDEFLSVASDCCVKRFYVFRHHTDTITCHDFRVFAFPLFAGAL